MDLRGCFDSSDCRSSDGVNVCTIPSGFRHPEMARFRRVLDLHVHVLSHRRAGEQSASYHRIAGWFSGARGLLDQRSGLRRHASRERSALRFG